MHVKFACLAPMLAVTLRYRLRLIFSLQYVVRARTAARETLGMRLDTSTCICTRRSACFVLRALLLATVGIPFRQSLACGLSAPEECIICIVQALFPCQPLQRTNAEKFTGLGVLPLAYRHIGGTIAETFLLASQTLLFMNHHRDQCQPGLGICLASRNPNP